MARRWRRPALLAVGVAAAVVAALVIPTIDWGGGGPSASADAVEALNSAADAAIRNAADETVPPGQYQYYETDSWVMSMSVTADPGGSTGSTSYAALVGTMSQRWTPQDWSGVWLERRSDTGRRQWLLGDEAEAKAAGIDPSAGGVPEPELRGTCQSYFQNVCTDPGAWQVPTKPWIDAMPRDPQQLYARLAADAKGHGTSDTTEMLVYATDALRQGLLPADLRAALYRAMSKIPGIEIVDSAVNLDGQVGMAFAIEAKGERSETIIDPTNGAFIGERRVSTTDSNGIPAGTVTGFTAVHSAVVDALGEVPTK